MVSVRIDGDFGIREKLMIRVFRLKIFYIILFLSCVFVTRLSVANEGDVSDTEDMFNKTIEELMNIPVVSASPHPE